MRLGAFRRALGNYIFGESVTATSVSAGGTKKRSKTRRRPRRLHEDDMDFFDDDHIFNLAFGDKQGMRAMTGVCSFGSIFPFSLRF